MLILTSFLAATPALAKCSWWAFWCVDPPPPATETNLPAGVGLQVATNSNDSDGLPSVVPSDFQIAVLDIEDFIAKFGAAEMYEGYFVLSAANQVIDVSMVSLGPKSDATWTIVNGEDDGVASPILKAPLWHCFQIRVFVWPHAASTRSMRKTCYGPGLSRPRCTPEWAPVHWAGSSGMPLRLGLTLCAI